MQILRTIDHALYPREAIRAARLAYKDYCDIQAQPLATGFVRLSISVLPAHEDNAREVVLSFLNYALDKAAETVLQDI